MAQALAIVAGACAVASGILSLVYAFAGQAGWAITTWNVLIVPPALYLGVRLARRMPILAAAATAAGVGASLLWAFGFTNSTTEPWWIGLASMWWLGIGLVMLPVWRRTAWLTLILGAAAAVDFVVTLLDLGLPLLALGGVKLPLTTAWSVVIGIVIVRDARARQEIPAIAAASAMAVVGGVAWTISGAGWLATHGTQVDFVNAELLGLRGTEFTQLQAVAPILWTVALVVWRPVGEQPAWARAAWATTLLGVMMVGAGALLETSLVDPNLEFRHPAVQGGWLLYVFGLVPVMCAGLLGMAATSRATPPVRAAFAVAGVLAPMPVLAFALGALADQGVGWTLAFAFLHAAPGLGWIAIGAAEPATTVEEPMEAPVG